jgi:hypothetical protein
VQPTPRLAAAMAAGRPPAHRHRHHHPALTLTNAATVLSALVLLLLVRAWTHHGQLTFETAHHVNLGQAPGASSSDRKASGLRRGNLETQVADAADSSSSSSSSTTTTAAAALKPKAAPLPPLPDKPLKFFGVGQAYHHRPKCPEGWAQPGAGCDAPPGCPVPWEWTTDRKGADAGESPSPLSPFFWVGSVCFAVCWLA